MNEYSQTTPGDLKQKADENGAQADVVSPLLFRPVPNALFFVLCF